MSDEHNALRQVLTSILADNIDHARAEASNTGFATTLWKTLCAGGFTTAIVPTEAGGAGGTVADLATILRTCGYHGAPVPLAETNTAGLVLAHASLEIPDGPLTIADTTQHPGCRQVGTAGQRYLVGTLHAVPWAGLAQRVVVIAQDAGQTLVGVLSEPDQVGNPSTNIAGEPIADLELCGDGLELRPLSTLSQTPVPSATVRQLMILTRALLITGSLRRVLALSVRYSREREQFGRPIGTFQAVGHQLAHLASAVQQADAIVGAAVAAVAAGQPASEVGLAAKVCTGEAAGLAIRVGHQVHGAIGVTEEHELHLHTRRLMAWRDQDGSEVCAARLLGRRVAQNGGRKLWELLTQHPDSQPKLS